VEDGWKKPETGSSKGSLRKSRKEEKAIALLLSDGHPSPLGEGPGVRAI